MRIALILSSPMWVVGVLIAGMVVGLCAGGFIAAHLFIHFSKE